MCAILGQKVNPLFKSYQSVSLDSLCRKDMDMSRHTYVRGAHLAL